jgi:hypothetical protein
VYRVRIADDSINVSLQENGKARSFLHDGRRSITAVGHALACKNFGLRVAGRAPLTPGLHSASKPHGYYHDISRTFSDGRAVAEEVASILDYRCISREVPIKAADCYGIVEARLFEVLEEKPRHWWAPLLESRRVYRAAL